MKSTNAVSSSSSVLASIERACARIAPTWPLDRFIAVNPFWGLIDERIDVVAAKMQATSGAQLLMPRAFFRQAHLEGGLRDEHLIAAARATHTSVSLDELRALLQSPEPTAATHARVVDVADETRDLVHQPSWRYFVCTSISQFCAAHFDDGQAVVGPDRTGGLYASWRRRAPADRSAPLLMGLTSVRRLADELPLDAHALIAEALAALEIEDAEQEQYLWGLLLDQNGWASWCAYRRFTARLAGGDDDAIVDLLAIRLAWELMLARALPTVTRRFKLARAHWPQIEADAAQSRARDWVLQTAMEIAWRDPVLRDLPRGLRAPRPTQASVQALFCIDVRSEVFRRALEATSPSVQTLGFAGFFGLPLEYRPAGAPTSRPQVPGPLAPRVRATDTGISATAEAQRAGRLDIAAAWQSFKSDALSTFTFVEALGLTYAADLVRDSFGLGSGPVASEQAGLSRDALTRRKPRLIAASDDGALDADARSELAAGMLRAMSLTRHFARLVLLAGHGSATRNNPHAAGLDCGACCGQTGEVNARCAAALLNDPAVRQGLAARNIAVPPETHFVAALHNTTTDDVVLFDVDEVPASHHDDLAQLRASLAGAGELARSERATRLGLAGRSASALHEGLRQRTVDWAQVRAEWGLADNAAFIVAPREHCQHLDLEGRSFLHEYRHAEDEGHRVLELIMTAPMVVTQWINLQYYASTVDNVRYGSGNKVLHNVVGSHVGVFEGNGGDLRIGLPMQSLHDGERWVHTPLRLTVFIEAPRDAIDQVLNKHAHVKALVANDWLTLVQIDDTDGHLYAREHGAWRALPSDSSSIAGGARGWRES